MTRIQKFKEVLFEEVGRLLTPHGFRGKFSGQTFFAPTEFGWAAFHLSFISHGQTDVDITADVSLRVNAVEEIVDRNKKPRPKDTATIGCELGNLSIARPRRWTIEEEADITPVAAAIEEAFTSIAWPYIHRYSNLETMYQVLSSNERSDSIHSPIPGARCQRAVALALVLKKPDITELIARCEAFLTQQPGEFNLRGFQKFVKEISSDL